MHAFNNGQSGHWLGPVTGLAAGSSSTHTAKLDIVKKSSLFLDQNFTDLFIGVRVRNTVFFGLHNINQC